MEKIKLNFDTDDGFGKNLKYMVEVPYKDGMVITNEYCPVKLLEGKVELLAAIRGETLDKFMENCRKQVIAISKIDDFESTIDKHVGGLMAVIMDHISRTHTLDYSQLLNYIDCFSLLLKSAGFDSEEIQAIYPRIFSTINDLYPNQIKMA